MVDHEGLLGVEFVAEYATPPSPGKTFYRHLVTAIWRVHGSLAPNT